MSEYLAQRALLSYFPAVYHMETNAWRYPHESDFLAVGRGRVHEVEIKCSKADFRQDFKKDKHKLFPRAMDQRVMVTYHGPENPDLQACAVDYDYLFQVLPNYFWYACPVGVIDTSIIPEYCGLLYLLERQNGYVARMVRHPRLIHNQYAYGFSHPVPNYAKRINSYDFA